MQVQDATTNTAWYEARIAELEELDEHQLVRQYVDELATLRASCAAQVAQLQAELEHLQHATAAQQHSGNAGADDVAADRSSEGAAAARYAGVADTGAGVTDAGVSVTDARGVIDEGAALAGLLGECDREGRKHARRARTPQRASQPAANRATAGAAAGTASSHTPAGVTASSHTPAAVAAAAGGTLSNPAQQGAQAQQQWQRAHEEVRAAVEKLWEAAMPRVDGVVLPESTLDALTQIRHACVALQRELSDEQLRCQALFQRIERASPGTLPPSPIAAATSALTCNTCDDAHASVPLQQQQQQQGQQMHMSTAGEDGLQAALHVYTGGTPAHVPARSPGAQDVGVQVALTQEVGARVAEVSTGERLEHEGHVRQLTHELASLQDINQRLLARVGELQGQGRARESGNAGSVPVIEARQAVLKVKEAAARKLKVRVCCCLVPVVVSIPGRPLMRLLLIAALGLRLNLNVISSAALKCPNSISASASIVPA